jgi:hypothetical protein
VILLSNKGEKIYQSIMKSKCSMEAAAAENSACLKIFGQYSVYNRNATITLFKFGAFNL